MRHLLDFLSHLSIREVDMKTIEQTQQDLKAILSRKYYLNETERYQINILCDLLGPLTKDPENLDVHVNDLINQLNTSTRDWKQISEFVLRLIANIKEQINHLLKDAKTLEQFPKLKNTPLIELTKAESISSSVTCIQRISALNSYYRISNKLVVDEKFEENTFSEINKYLIAFHHNTNRLDEILYKIHQSKSVSIETVSVKNLVLAVWQKTNELDKEKKEAARTKLLEQLSHVLVYVSDHENDDYNLIVLLKTLQDFDCGVTILSNDNEIRNAICNSVHNAFLKEVQTMSLTKQAHYYDELNGYETENKLEKKYDKEFKKSLTTEFEIYDQISGMNACHYIEEQLLKYHTKKTVEANDLQLYLLQIWIDNLSNGRLNQIDKINCVRNLLRLESFDYKFKFDTKDSQIESQLNEFSWAKELFDDLVKNKIINSETKADLMQSPIGFALYTLRLRKNYFDLISECMKNLRQRFSELQLLQLCYLLQQIAYVDLISQVEYLKKGSKTTEKNVEQLCVRYLRYRQANEYMNQYLQLCASDDSANRLALTSQKSKEIMTSLCVIYNICNVNSDNPYTFVDDKLKNTLRDMRDLSSGYANKLSQYAKQENLFFSSKRYAPRKSYTDITVSENDVLNKVIIMYSDYVSGCKYWWGRSHKAEANLMVSILNKIARSGNDVMTQLQKAKRQIREGLDQLEVSDKLNVEGSFSRRSRFCLDLLETEIKKLTSSLDHKHSNKESLVEYKRENGYLSRLALTPDSKIEQTLKM